MRPCAKAFKNNSSIAVNHEFALIAGERIYGQPGRYHAMDHWLPCWSQSFATIGRTARDYSDTTWTVHGKNVLFCGFYNCISYLKVAYAIFLYFYFLFGIIICMFPSICLLKTTERLSRVGEERGGGASDIAQRWRHPGSVSRRGHILHSGESWATTGTCLWYKKQGRPTQGTSRLAFLLAMECNILYYKICVQCSKDLIIISNNNKNYWNWQYQQKFKCIPPFLWNIPILIYPPGYYWNCHIWSLDNNYMICF